MGPGCAPAEKKQDDRRLQCTDCRWWETQINRGRTGQSGRKRQAAALADDDGCCRESRQWRAQGSGWYRISQRGGKARNKNKQFVTYRVSTTQCQACSPWEQCLSAKSRYRKIQRSVHEAAVERNRQRLKYYPNQARDRSSIVQHFFGTFKHNWQMSHFMMRTSPKCQGISRWWLRVTISNGRSI